MEQKFKNDVYVLKKDIIEVYKNCKKRDDSESTDDEVLLLI